MTYAEMLAEAQSRGLAPAGASMLTATGEVVHGGLAGGGSSGPGSPSGFYGDAGIGINGGSGGGALPVAYNGGGGAAVVATPAVLGVVVIAGGVIARLFGMAMVRRILGWMGSQGIRRGVQVAWSRIPFWIRAILPALGASAGYDVIFDLDDSSEAFVGPQMPALPGGGGDMPMLPGQQAGPGVGIIGGWVANGRQFYRLSDGRLATQKNDGRWTVWRPKKPIVMYATGAADLDVLLRADRAVDKQTGKLAKMMRRRGYNVNKKTGKVPC